MVLQKNVIFENRAVWGILKNLVSFAFPRKQAHVQSQFQAVSRLGEECLDVLFHLI